MTEPPITAYYERAANRPKPDDWKDPSPALMVLQLFGVRRMLARLVNTFWNDVSQYQPYVNSTYSYPVFSHRLDSGWGWDDKAVGTLTRVAGMRKTIKIHEGYTVYVPNQEKAQLTRVKKLLGTKPTTKVDLLMQDIETGDGFAGPGDHSTGLNWIAGEFADYMGSPLRIKPYANGNDYGIYKHIASWLLPRKHQASYGTNDPGTPFWQYAGGDPRWGSPGGYPRSNKTFGSYVDFNVSHKSVAQMQLMFGLITPEQKDEFDMAKLADLQKIVNAAMAEIKSLVSTNDKATQNQIAALQADVDWVKKMMTGHDGDPAHFEVLADMGANHVTHDEATKKYLHGYPDSVANQPKPPAPPAHK